MNELTKILSDKRRLFRDEETKLHEIERKIRDKQFHERTIVEKLKHEYDDLRNQFEQMACDLRFSIEDELKIYSRLLDELTKKSGTFGSTVPTPITTQQIGTGSATTYTTTSTVRSGGIEDHDPCAYLKQGNTNLHISIYINTIDNVGATSSIWPQVSTTTFESVTTNIDGPSINWSMSG